VVGCGTVSKEADPLVVRAEQIHSDALAATDQFLAWERANEPVAPAALHTTAESLRKQAPTAFRALRSATKAYKANRNADNKATLETVVAVVAQILTDTQAAIVRAGLTNAERGTRNADGEAVLAVAPMVIVAAIDGLLRLIALINGMVAEAKRTKEWTPEEEALVDAKLEETLKQPHWKPRT
jgi:hypothetical protein